MVAKTVLTEEDRQSGVALVDIGAGVTSVAIYQGGIMRSYVAIPFGGKTITGDIRTECSISEDLAEKIKLKFGACMPGKLASLSEKVLQIRLTEPYKEVTVKYISEVIDARSQDEKRIFHRHRRYRDERPGPVFQVQGVRGVRL